MIHAQWGTEFRQEEALECGQKLLATVAVMNPARGIQQTRGWITRQRPALLMRLVRIRLFGTQRQAMLRIPGHIPVRENRRIIGLALQRINLYMLFISKKHIFAVPQHIIEIQSPLFHSPFFIDPIYLFKRRLNFRRKKKNCPWNDPGILVIPNGLNQIITKICSPIRWKLW